ncbi:MAG: 50S ribosomal protein L28 [Patescibacteria group bacterium]
MAYRCEICGKKTVAGRSQQHKRGVAGRRWKKRAPSTHRLFKPNLQKKTLVISGEKKKMKICTKCLKRIKKYGGVRNYSNVTVA